MGQSTMKLLNLGSTVFGGALKGGNAIGGAFGDYQQAGYESSILKNNAALAEWSAQNSLRAGAAQEQEIKIKGAQTIGSQKAALAGRGIVVNQDTADVIASDVQRYATLDAATAKENAAREAFAYRMQGYAYSTEAKMRKKQGMSDLLSGLFQGGSTLLSTGMTVASKWKTFGNDSTSSNLNANPQMDYLGY